MLQARFSWSITRPSPSPQQPLSHACTNNASTLQLLIHCLPSLPPATHLKSTHGSSKSSKGTSVLGPSWLVNSAGNQNSFNGCSASKLLLRPLSGRLLLPRGCRGLLLPVLDALLCCAGDGRVATVLLLLLLPVLTVAVALAAASVPVLVLPLLREERAWLLLGTACAEATGPVDCCRRSSAAASALRSATRCRFRSTRDCVACKRCMATWQGVGRTAGSRQHLRSAPVLRCNTFDTL